MAIHVQHTYSTTTEIIYTRHNQPYKFYETAAGKMDDIFEHVCDVMIYYDFDNADVCSTETGEVLMIVNRT